MPTTITVDGMSCGHCEQTVADAIEAVSGVTHVTVDRTAGTATVEGEVDSKALVAAVEDAGYEASA
ncbi:heavy-metal-associated domain-containing protein [Haloarcula marina]|uniref:heavy-metal-associated domain-containing protein n=1 Tax=Haloarcula marina TaxID=2961574 RepID=UPI0020B6741F|nr:heavy metal-associated domain-containing protein [Halomicroarcula marina]